jgi:hypothetical protein
MWPDSDVRCHHLTHRSVIVAAITRDLDLGHAAGTGDLQLDLGVRPFERERGRRRGAAHDVVGPESLRRGPVDEIGARRGASGHDVAAGRGQSPVVARRARLGGNRRRQRGRVGGRRCGCGWGLVDGGRIGSERSAGVAAQILADQGEGEEAHTDRRGSAQQPGRDDERGRAYTNHPAMMPERTIRAS